MTGSPAPDARPRFYNGTPRVRVRSMIHVRFLRGLGTEDDPVRRVDRFYFEDGSLAAEVDPASQASDMRAERSE